MMGLVPAVWRGVSMRMSLCFVVVPMLAYWLGYCELAKYLVGGFLIFVLSWYWFAGYKFREYVNKSIATDLKDINAFYNIDRGSTMLVAECDGAIVGCVALDQKSSTVAELRRMSVSPACRGRGVASKLLYAIMNFAREQQYRSVILSTTEYQVAAMNLYIKYGFSKVAYHTEIIISCNHLVFDLNSEQLTLSRVHELREVFWSKIFEGKSIKIHPLIKDD
eukprot:TRINITY_DN13427_c0_g1_i1.p1 TRINITY_DN13427_c0_g1~~TRINITY_DN13427_c0_g1_i1.p1  ORF type:complete len:221 (+),score=19.54 TRINITY_DN13427_c0_g1_i1:143-805(+)